MSRIVENEPIYFGQGGTNPGYGDGLGGSAGLIALLALLGNRRGFSDDSSYHGIGDIRSEIKETESEIRDSIHEQTTHTAAEFRNLSERLCESNKEAIKAGYEARIQTAEIANLLSNKIDRETDQIKNKLQSMEVNTDKQFCSLSHDLERSFHRIEERELREENRELRDRIFRDSQTTQTNTLLTAINALTTAIGGAVPTPLSKQS